MMNFLFGAIAGGLIACVATITAARQPEVQLRLGLVQPAQAAVAAPPTRPAPECQPAAGTGGVEQKDAADALFAPRRFWYVAPVAK